jgi:hypothetical protein
MIIEIALGILLAFFLIITIPYWLPILLGLTGLMIVLVILLIAFLIFAS